MPINAAEITGCNQIRLIRRNAAASQGLKTRDAPQVSVTQTNRLLLACLCLWFSTGCVYLPQISRQATVHNPFPQLQKVAVAPFFNLSTEPTVDGRHVALAYFNELQNVPGFEVIPIGVVEKALEAHQLSLSGPAEARQLAQALGVDAVVVGAVTDFTPYYPPRFALQVEWYAANPCFHPIPPGYGLPWGTPSEDEIPGPLIFEAEMALARAQMKTQTPRYPKSALLLPMPGQDGEGLPPHANPGLGLPGEQPPQPEVGNPRAGEQVAHQSALPGNVTTGAAVVTAPAAPGLPGDWPDPRGLAPPGPMTEPPACQPSDDPVLRHTKTYNGHDPDVTAALASYVYFRDDARYGGWQAYLQRSDDFIRFCCHMHISEMLTARGGAGETRVVWRWPVVR